MRDNVHTITTTPMEVGSLGFSQELCTFRDDLRATIPVPCFEACSEDAAVWLSFELRPRQSRPPFPCAAVVMGRQTMVGTSNGRWNVRIESYWLVATDRKRFCIENRSGDCLQVGVVYTMGPEVRGIATVKTRRTCGSREPAAITIQQTLLYSWRLHERTYV